jgi:flagellar assembly protein FliH
MVKIASNVAIFGQLRDIRLSPSKNHLTSGSQNGNGSSSRVVLESAEDALRAKEQAGYLRGQKEAEDRAARQIEALRTEFEASHRTAVIRALEDLNKTVHLQMGETFKSLEKHVVMLAAEAAIKLTSGIPISADMVEAYVGEAMNLVEQDTEVTIILNPEDLALLEQHQSSLLNRAGAYPVIKLRADQKISRGGCLVETKFGELDARRETKIELLKKAVNE